MTAFWALLTGNPIARALAKVLGLVLAVLTFGAWQRRQEAKDAKAEANEATIEAVFRANEGAAEAVSDLRKGETPAQVKAKNDAKWRLK